MRLRRKTAFFVAQLVFDLHRLRWARGEEFLFVLGVQILVVELGDLFQAHAEFEPGEYRHGNGLGRGRSALIGFFRAFSRRSRARLPDG